ncbi:MAG: hypothetical protein FIA97_02025, partial [Methylococcaceae bacterium]|nr:hypothetical protein [Methylococcaceae bacterium]
MKQDFASLRAEGIRQLERLTGPSWTDFNAHDPGITLLEQICYVLTDLDYRIGYGLPDVLARAGEDTYEGLFGPDRVLVSRPVTLPDLRKLVLDVPGVANAWIEQAADASPNLYFQESRDLDGAAESIRLAPNDESRSVPIKGLYRVLIDPAEESGIDSAALIAAVAARLHANRCLCADVASVSVPEMLKVAVHATVEIEPAADAETVYLAMLERIDAYLSPSVRFHTVSERLDSGYSLAEICEGPLLTHGFLDDDELQSMPRRTSLYTSDLLCRLMDVPGVRMVDFL